MSEQRETLYIGMDVGSTTVKAVVVDPVSDEIVWQVINQQFCSFKLK